MDLRVSLNDEQRRAVEHPGGALLVVAGAGSGKTRVLTARVARLLASGVPARGILAFTFTNRAAREMRERILAAAGEMGRELWIGTFHATGVRLLRREAAAAGIPPDFTIYDREDQEGVLRGLIRRLELPEGTIRLGQVIERISDAKNALVGPAEFERTASSPQGRRDAEIYGLYQRELARAGALDFDDLIALPVRLLRERPDLAERYGRRFQHVLVDEFQDTNHAQFRLVAALAAVHGNLFAVGDDDQSIYAWRGADPAHVLEFERAFPGAAVLRLEQNYRSTGNILRAANAVIANNRARRGKNLWCERGDGPRLRFELALDEADEAALVRRFLEDHLRGGGRLDEAAVLYRTNAQSRALETELRRTGLVYELVGGVAFYQRREVKDLLAYLRLAVNPADGASFWRVWNTPRRGLGPGARGLVESTMAARGLPPVEALRALAAEGALTRAAANGAGHLLGVLDEISARCDEPVDALLVRVVHAVSYLEHLDALGEENVAERRANVEELVAAAGSFAAADEAGVDGEEGAPRPSALARFLAESALVSDVDRLAENADRVLLLTAHNAKGLEFDAVVVTGLEEGLFPHASSLEDPNELEEERRLFYVALTRARERVLLTAAGARRRYGALGSSAGARVSRFVGEIPAAVLESGVTPAFVSSARSASGAGARAETAARRRAGRETEREETRLHASAEARRIIGREVYHERFGKGIVVDAEGEAGNLKCTVRFAEGTRKVLGRFLMGGGDEDPA
ncbi:MAG TPA: UvrD-helicase domain-containing protein [Terriglobales bacterium]|nr:UvrD-helicase domain-containing protein [Terriglobales bacterium]